MSERDVSFPYINDKRGTSNSDRLPNIGHFMLRHWFKSQKLNLKPLAIFDA